MTFIWKIRGKGLDELKESNKKVQQTVYHPRKRQRCPWLGMLIYIRAEPHQLKRSETDPAMQAAHHGQVDSPRMKQGLDVIGW